MKPSSDIALLTTTLPFLTVGLFTLLPMISWLSLVDLRAWTRGARG